jgi:hypothetical protein
MKHTKFVLAALAAMSLTMPACGGDTKKEEKKTETKTEKTETKTETKEVTAPDAKPADRHPALFHLRPGGPWDSQARRAVGTN